MITGEGECMEDLFKLFRLFENNDGNWGNVLCPHCGFEFVHLNHRAYSTLHDDNRQALHIPMYCESGHYWDVVLRERKGELQLTVENMRGMGLIEGFKEGWD
jgi:hypothetical protein